MSLIGIEKMIAAKYPIHAIKWMATRCWGESGDFKDVYTAKSGASTPREPLPKGKVLQTLYTRGVDAGRPFVLLVGGPAVG